MTDNSRFSIAALAAAALLSGCGGKTDDAATIRVAASVTPHSEILEFVKPALAAKGFKLEIRTFEDYVQPNLVVESGDFDANYVEHIPFLASINEEKGLHLVNAGGIHYEPFGIYPGKKKSLAELADGDEIAVPNDTTNEARALLLLEANGVLKLREGAGLTATRQDVESYAVKVKLVELEAAQVARVRGDAAFAVLNGNYALQAGLSVGRDALVAEAPDSPAARTYVNVVAVKDGRQDEPGIRALVEALKSPETAGFIRATYDGAVVPFSAE
ncbi:MAG: MetQ/NlpA family ABC transporter substrate-binding protein [Kiritimatiellae bacterium]|nr:MetQ/NlpA family ABC transporter substrate-binding protein [Kiritimatiellia bacterium]